MEILPSASQVLVKCSYRQSFCCAGTFHWGCAPSLMRHSICWSGSIHGKTLQSSPSTFHWPSHLVFQQVAINQFATSWNCQSPLFLGSHYKAVLISRAVLTLTSCFLTDPHYLSTLLIPHLYSFAWPWLPLQQPVKDPDHVDCPEPCMPCWLTGPLQKVSHTQPPVSNQPTHAVLLIPKHLHQHLPVVLPE